MGSTNNLAAQASDEPMRAAFEAWLKSGAYRLVHPQRAHSGKYVHPGIENDWNVWQAAYARASEGQAQAAAPADERARFEAWYAPIFAGGEIANMPRRSSGEYVSVQCQIAWLAWQASPIKSQVSAAVPLNSKVADYVIAEMNANLFGQRMTPQMELTVKEAMTKCLPLYVAAPLRQSAALADERARFEAYMLKDLKCIVGSRDPYPAGIEREHWKTWQAAWNAAQRAAQPADKES